MPRASQLSAYRAAFFDIFLFLHPRLVARPADSDSNNELDRAERFRLFDGLSNNNEGLDKGVKEYGVMTIEVSHTCCRGAIGWGGAANLSSY